VYSLNVPLPPAVRDLVREVRPALAGFRRVRGVREATLVCKRLDAADRREYLDASRAARDALRGAPAFEARIAGVGVFDEPAAGPGPLVYLAVESPGLVRVHESLVADLGAVEGIEGDDYVPHVTLARDGPPRAVRRVRELDLDPVTWAVEALEFYDADHRERVEVVGLPA